MNYEFSLKWYTENREKHIKELYEAASEIKFKTQRLKDILKIFIKGEGIINGFNPENSS